MRPDFLDESNSEYSEQSLADSLDSSECEIEEDVVSEEVDKEKMIIEYERDLKLLEDEIRRLLMERMMLNSVIGELNRQNGEYGLPDL